MKARQATLATAVWLAAAAATMGFASRVHADPEIGQCDIQQLAVAAGPQQAGAGHRAIPLNFTVQPDVSPCQLSGYPTVEALVGTTTVPAAQTPSGYLGGATLGTVTLGPGHGAHAVVEWVASGTADDPVCPTYGPNPTDVRLRVIPPGIWQTFSVPMSIGPNEGLCSLQVHPLAAD